jgi:hypothetical protein
MSHLTAVQNGEMCDFIDRSKLATWQLRVVTTGTANFVRLSSFLKGGHGQTDTQKKFSFPSGLEPFVMYFDSPVMHFKFGGQLTNCAAFQSALLRETSESSASHGHFKR